MASDLTGTKFGRWNIVDMADRVNGYVKWNCVCECGNKKTIYDALLRPHSSRQSKSCGCLKSELVKERFKTHGHESNGKVSSEYTAWHGMLQRCGNPNHKYYGYYGGRGITVCDSWKDFNNFIADMGSKPSKGHSIDRIENGGNYEPSNCKWATIGEQAANKRVRSDSKVGVRGVSWHKIKQRFHVRITANKKHIHIGYYKTLEEATEARKQAEITYNIA